MSARTVIATIQGKEYSLACDAGQEQHLNNLLVQFNQRVDLLVRDVGRLSEPMMLLYTALMFADELSDATRENARLRAELSAARAQVANGGEDARVAALEEGMAESLHALASRIEGIAEKLAA